MIEFENVSFSYYGAKEKFAVRNVNLSIKKGEVVLFCGKSGCGKTSLVRLVNGLIPNYYQGCLEGTVQINGEKQTKIEQTSKIVGSVFQNPRTQFFNVETTSEVVFACENFGINPKDMELRLEKTIDKFQLEHLLNRNLFKLSGGEKQKIACASVDMAQTEIVVMDEPTSNLDTKSIQTLQEVLKIWKQQGKTILIAEHRISYLRDIVNRVILVEDGQIVFDLPINEFLSKGEDVVNFGLRCLNPIHFSEKSVAECNETAIEVQDLSVCYEKEIVLSIPSLRIPKGRIVGLIGHNGAGKTTFAHCLCGLLKEESGKIFFDEKLKKHNKRKQECYLVFQDVNHQLFTESVLDEVILGAKPPYIDNGVDELIADLGLSQLQTEHPMSLSGGEKQRVAIASAITSQRKILIYDEPTSGLDYVHMNQFALQLENLSQKGFTQLVITHDPELIEKCCDYVICFQKGGILWQGNLDKEISEIMSKFFKL
ncbi:MAG: ABC transporter ATP-binding protein [Eubacteriales bacterium]